MGASRAINRGSIIIFFLVFAVFFAVGYPWFLDGEDMGYVFLVSQIKSFWQSFAYGQLMVVAPFEYLSTSFYDDCKHSVNFLTTYYRPVVTALTYVQYQFFGLHSWCYYAVTIGMHALISSMIFRFVAPLVGIISALGASLFFAFHPTLMGWIGKLDTQSAQISTLLAILVLLLCKQAVVQRKPFFLALSLLAFFICLLSREAFFGLPMIIFLVLSVLPSPYVPAQWATRVRYQVLMVASFALILGIYFGLRLWNFPFVPSTDTIIFKMPSVSVSRFFHFLYDMFWLQWLPWSSYAFFKAHASYYFLYVGAKVLLVGFLLFSFLTNVTKNYVIVAFLCVTTFYWQFLFGAGPGIKQLYESLPFLAVGFGLLVGNASAWRWRVGRWAAFTFFTIGIVINAITVLYHARSLRAYGIKKMNATDRLQNRAAGTLIKKPLVYLSNTALLSNVGILQASWLKGVSSQPPHIFITCLALAQHASYADVKAHCKIRKIPSGFTISSEHPDVWLYRVDTPMPDYLQITVNRQQEDKIFDVTLLFHESLYHPDMTLVMWFFDDEDMIIVA